MYELVTKALGINPAVLVAGFAVGFLTCHLINLPLRRHARGMAGKSIRGWRGWL